MSERSITLVMVLLILAGGMFLSLGGFRVEEKTDVGTWCVGEVVYKDNPSTVTTRTYTITEINRESFKVEVAIRQSFTPPIITILEIKNGGNIKIGRSIYSFVIEKGNTIKWRRM